MPSPNDFVPGKMWTAQATPRNRINDIPTDGFVWITFVRGLDVSLYVDKGGRRLRITREALAVNFYPVPATPPNLSYIGMQLALALYR